MILNGLCEYYDRKAALGEMPPYGREEVAIPYLIVISSKGDFVKIEPTEEGDKHKPHKFLLPKKSLGRTSKAIVPNNCYDKVTYVFGALNDNDAKRDTYNKQQDSFIERINELITLNKDAKATGLESVSEFYKKYEDNLKLIRKDKLFSDATKKDNTLFAFKVLEDPPIIVGETNLKLPVKIEKEGRCLVTGEAGVPLIRISNQIKINSKNANSTGVVLVGFNNESFNSYGKSQCENAPISQLADFKYTSALDALMRSERNCMTFAGNDKLIFWASANNALEDDFRFFFDIDLHDDPDKDTEFIKNILTSPLYGKISDEKPTKFFIALISPQKSRMALKLWIEGTVDEIVEHIRKYFNDIEIESNYNDNRYMILGNLLRNISLNQDQKNLPPQLFSSLMTDILKGLPFPQILQMQVLDRTKSDKGKIEINGKLYDVMIYRAALLKAYLNRKRNNNEKEIKMALDYSNDNQAYLCGRLFAIYENLQQRALGELNSTIRDQYYDSFSSTPTKVLGLLTRLSNHHLEKLKPSSQIYYEKLIGNVMSMMKPDSLPAYFSLDDQSRFAIGYYQQRQELYKKNEDATEA